MWKKNPKKQSVIIILDLHYMATIDVHCSGFFPSAKVQNDNVDEKMSYYIDKEVSSKWVKWQFWVTYPFNYLSACLTRQSGSDKPYLAP